MRRGGSREGEAGPVGSIFSGVGECATSAGICTGSFVREGDDW